MKNSLGLGLGVLILLGGPVLLAIAILVWMALAVINILLGAIR
jgi:hypothetical protein